MTFLIRVILIYPVFKVLQALYWWYQLRSFKSTEGKVIQSGVKKLPDTKYALRNHLNPLYRERLQYQYVVDEERYIAHAISIVDEHFVKGNRQGRGKRNAEYWHKLYPKGRTITVYYDPKNPERAFLYKTVFDKNSAIMITIALTMAFMLLLGVLFQG